MSLFQPHPPGKVPATCSSCPWYGARHVEPELQEKAAAAGHPLPEGHCWRFPRVELKRPDEFCGEHPTFQRHTRRMVVDEIAWAVGTAVAVAIGQPVDRDKLAQVIAQQQDQAAAESVPISGAAAVALPGIG